MKEGEQMKFKKRKPKRKKIGSVYANELMNSFFREYVKCNTEEEKDILFKAYHASR